ncbi:MAG TPA: HK97 family phage prohead protease [Vicinamibacterales bacterium]|nr:HK97 family phage prohead protease [Vicinamibacterales bacterium]
MKRKSLDVVEANADADPRKAHITLKAVTTVGTDEGTFTAVISTESVDRERDIVVANAMVKALRAWIEVGKLIPLAWQHSPKAEDQIGHIDPALVKAVEGEVVASGWIDQSTDRGKHAWRLVKSGTLGFSFGYLTLAATKREGGGNHITELDVFEVSATPTPMNHDTRVLGWKSTEDLREEAARVEREVEQIQIPDVPEAPPAPEEPEIDLAHELQEVKSQLAETRELLEDLRKKADVADKEPQARSADPLRKQAEAVALEFASDGQSLRRPPKTVEPTPPEPSLSLKELKQRTRDEMLGVLSGGTIE